MTALSLTLLEVVGFPHIDAHKGHELQLGEALSGWGWQGEQVSQVTYLCVDQVTAQLAGPLGRLAGIEAAKGKKSIRMTRAQQGKGKKLLFITHMLQSTLMTRRF